MPLESLELTNFQIHKKQTLEFDPLITVLVGRTDAGKSAILRALRWVAQNVPAGQEFIRDGSKFARALLSVDGHKVLRRIGKANEYKLDGKRFRAFGRSVPPEISKLLNVRDENFQEQLDGPFWLSLTPGQIGKELNAIINLTAIDETLSLLSSETRKASQNVELIRERLQEAKEDRNQLAWVPEMTGKLAELQGQRQRLAAKAQKRVILSDLVRQAAKNQRLKDNAAKAQAAGLPALQTGERLLAVRQQEERLRELLHKLKQGKVELCRLEKRARKAKSEFNESTKGQTCPICLQRMP